MKTFPLKALSIVFYFVVLTIHSQTTDYSSFTIPLELKENANAVVRNQNTEIEVISRDNMSIKVNRVITILNKMGNSKVGAYAHYDDNSKISKLSAKIYDASGNLIKKVNKGKFVDVSAVDGGSLYSDSRVTYLDYTPTSYPYTIHFNYELKTSSTGFLPNWNPLESYLIGVEKNTFLINLNGNKARIKEKNLNDFEVVKVINENKIYYEVNNLTAYKSESLSPSLKSFSPQTLIALNGFKTDGVNGYYTSWKEFGLWMNNSLLKGRNTLDGETKIKILELVKDIEDPIEKAKIVYKFMQDKTRYISVQVGIGGIQPISAQEVDNVGYGDCKGLTNYTKSLLDLVGVTSYYSHIEANTNEKVSFENDFASLEQGNHVILNLPNKNGEDIWLECTSQIAPFGFLGDFTDDRDALVITPEGGIIKHTTSYKNEQNLQKLKASVKLDDTGNLTGKVEIKSFGIQYDSKYVLDRYNAKEKEQYYLSNLWSYNNNLSINNLSINNDKEKISYLENIKFDIKEYATKSSDKLLLRVNVLNVNRNIPKRFRNRKMPLKINRGYKDVDEIEIELPDGVKVDGELFQDIKIENKFGAYKVSITKVTEHKLLYKRSLLIKEGLYPKEDYKKYRSFRKKVARNDNIRIAITKIN